MYALLQRLCDPFVLTYLALAVAVFELCWRRRLSRFRLFLLSTLVLLLGVVATPMAAYLAAGSLEWQLPHHAHHEQEAEAIVVLSGWVLPPDEVRAEPELGASTLYRCLKAAELYRVHGPCTIVLCGGHLPPDAEFAFGDVMHDFMLTQNIPDSDLLVEDRSTTTHENAVEAGLLLQERHIEKVILVTDAMHLPRAAACFRAQGIDAIPVGCQYRSAGFQWRFEAFIPNAKSAAVVANATHDWVGLIWYWICGRI